MNNKLKYRLADKVVLITGAGRGIGEAIAKLFAEEGAFVVVNARTEAHVQHVVTDILNSNGKAHGIVADISSQENVNKLIQETVAHFGGIDILVHNAAIFPFQTLDVMEDQDWCQVIETNLTSAFRLTKACLPHIKKRGQGRVLFTSSITGNRTGVVGLAHYGASKSGINGFIRAIAMELAPYGITVNGVEPGLVLTDGVLEMTSQEERDAMAHFVPLKRWGTPTDVAQAMLFLASDAANYITGQTIIIDGGALLPENGALMG
jgi:3-oxoacyl-[acyl-carrier protein] reductase